MHKDRGLEYVVEQLPGWLVLRENFGLGVVQNDLADVLEAVEGGRDFLMGIYRGVHNLDISSAVHVHPVMIFAMDPSEFLPVYATACLMKQNSRFMGVVKNGKPDLYQVVSAMHKLASIMHRQPLNFLKTLDDMYYDSYTGRGLKLQLRLAELPPIVAESFMDALSQPLLHVPDSNSSLAYLTSAHFALKYADSADLLLHAMRHAELPGLQV